MSLLGIWIAIKEWFLSLAIVDQIFGAILSFSFDSLLKGLWTRIKPSPEEKAFKRALKKWKKHFHLRGSCDKQRRLKSISDFSNYVITHHGVYDQYIDSLHDFFERELEKTHEGKQFLDELRTKALNKDVYEGLLKAEEILKDLKSMHEMQEAIWKELNTFQGIYSATVLRD